MKYKLVRSSEVKDDDLGFIKIKTLLNSEDVPNMSAAIVRIDGVNKKAVNTVSDTLYYVLQGEGVFTIEGEEMGVAQGDLVLVPKGSVYFDKGAMTLLAVAHPRFSADDVEYLE